MLVPLAQSTVPCCSLLLFLHGHLSNAKVLTFVGQGNSLLPWDEEAMSIGLACVASISARVCRERWDESKKKGNDGGGKRKKCLPPNPTILKNCFRPQTYLLIGAVLVMLIN